MKLTNTHVGETAYIKSGFHGGRSGRILRVYLLKNEVMATMALSETPDMREGYCGEFPESILEFDAPKKPKFIVVNDPYPTIRRERIATAIMAAMYQNSLWLKMCEKATKVHTIPTQKAQWSARDAVDAADALIAALDKGDADAPAIT